jgi:hypothetical protein
MGIGDIVQLRLVLQEIGGRFGGKNGRDHVSIVVVFVFAERVI